MGFAASLTLLTFTHYWGEDVDEETVLAEVNVGLRTGRAVCLSVERLRPAAACFCQLQTNEQGETVHVISFTSSPVMYVKSKYCDPEQTMMSFQMKYCFKLEVS